MINWNAFGGDLRSIVAFSSAECSTEVVTAKGWEWITRNNNSRRRVILKQVSEQLVDYS